MSTRRKGTLRLCIGASAGGHLTELLRLSDSWAGHSVFCVSTLDIVAEQLRRFGEVYIIGECNREHPLRAMSVLYRAIRLMWRERPDVVLTTGSLPLALVCLAAKLFGAKVIWIDSITNVARLSMSGRMMRHFSDLCLTQWPHLAEEYRGVEYVGAIV